MQGQLELAGARWTAKTDERSRTGGGLSAMGC